MKKIEHYILPEHANALYKNEAVSSMALAKETADKINELIDAFNELAKSDIEHEQDQDGRIAKAILYMKDNLINSLQDLMNMLLENGFIDERIELYCKDLNNRLDTILTKTKPGSITTMDAEVIDARTGILSNDYKSLGEAIRNQLKEVVYASSGTYSLKNKTIVAETGVIHDNATRLLSSLIAIKNYKSLSCDILYQLRLFYYDCDLNYIGAGDWGQTFDLKAIDSNVVFIRFVASKRTNDKISVDDVNPIKIELIKDVEILMPKTSKYQFTDLELFNGTITNAGTFDYRTNRLITKIMKADFTKIEVNNGYKVKLACYDSNMVAIPGNDFKTGVTTQSDLLEGTEYMQIIISNKEDADMLPSENVGLIIHTDTDLSIEYSKQAPAFAHELMNTAYSSINLGIANTKMHFDLSARFGFNALKGDVRITKDDKLIMCHDDGLTTSVGMIYPYDANSNTKIINLNSNVLNYYTHAERLGYLPASSQHLCTFEEYIQICVKHNKIAYITVRENKTAKVIELCIETLKKYNMLERCVFNSYEYEALQMVRKYSSSIPVSLVLKHEVAVEKGDIEKVACLGNGILTLFYAPSDSVQTMLSNSVDLFAYAKERNVILHMAQVSKYDDYIKCINAGIKGFHLLKPLQEHCVKYQLKFNWDGAHATLLNEDLTATFENYEGGFVINNIKKVGTTLEYDDGLPMWLLMREKPALLITTEFRSYDAHTPIAYYEMESLSIDSPDYTGNITLTVIL